jgi:hypothetical protein
VPAGLPPNAQLSVPVGEGKSLPEIKQQLGEPDPPAGAPPSGPQLSDVHHCRVQRVVEEELTITIPIRSEL